MKLSDIAIWVVLVILASVGALWVIGMVGIALETLSSK